MRTFLFLGGSILGLTAPAYAQDASDAEVGADEMVLASDAFEIDEDAITITVTGNPSEVEDTGQPVTVIGAEEIAQIQGPDLTRVLRRVPGVTINRTGGLGATTGVSVRGASNDQLLVLIDGVRVDDGVYEGGEVSMFYDPMIAKLVTWGETRDEAADLQVQALDAFRIEGLGHNVDFLSAIMQHPRFRSGELTTGFIAEEYPEGFEGAAVSDDLKRGLAAVAGVIATADADRARRIEGQLSDDLYAPGDWTVRLGDTDYRVTLEEEAITVDDAPVALQMEYTPGERMVEVELDDQALTLQLEPTRTGYAITTRGAKHTVRILQTRIAHLADHMIEKIPPDLSKMLICPMPGLLVKLHVGEGEEVQPGQPLATVEAMKMENILRAEKAGTIAKINAEEGESLAVDAVILELE